MDRRPAGARDGRRDRRSRIRLVRRVVTHPVRRGPVERAAERARPRAPSVAFTARRARHLCGAGGSLHRLLARGIERRRGLPGAVEGGRGDSAHSVRVPVSGVKVPLVYTSVALRNWTAFKKLGISGASAPGMYHTGARLETPTVIGGYDPTPKSPDDPILVRMTRTPCKPGLPSRDQHRAGHVDLLTTPFSTFELKIRDQLARTLGGGGFDPARDIDAITVNRWPHGYAYEYNPLWDPDWPEGQSPCEIGRKPFGRITIANSDAAAAAYTDQAMDQAYRAVAELIAARAT